MPIAFILFTLIHVIDSEIIDCKDRAMGVYRYILCGLVVIIGIILSRVATWRDVFSFKNEMLVLRELSEVYEHIADLRNHAEFHPYLEEALLLHTETSSDGIQQRTFRIKDQIPLPLGLRLPITFDVLETLTKPNEEFLLELEVGGSKGISRWNLKSHNIAERDEPGTFITEEYTMECMWILCGFTQDRAKSSHQELFIKMKSALDKGHKTIDTN